MISANLLKSVFPVRKGAFLLPKMRFYTDFTLVFFRFLHHCDILISAERKKEKSKFKNRKEILL